MSIVHKEILNRKVRWPYEWKPSSVQIKYYKHFLTQAEFKLRNVLHCITDTNELIKTWDMLLNPEKYNPKDKPLTKIEKDSILRTLCKIDRVFLMTRVLMSARDKEHFFNHLLTHPWLYERCREAENRSDGHLHLWARGHAKTTLINVHGILQEFLINDKVKICIISYDDEFGKKQLEYIKAVLETNEILKYLFPNAFYQNPKSQAPSGKWGVKKLYLKSSTDKDPSLSYCSIRSLDVGAHYNILIFDDVITSKAVNSAENREAAIQAIALSKAIGVTTDLTGFMNRQWYIGTRYHSKDPYQFIIDNKIAIPVIRAATSNGKKDGPLVFMTKLEWDKWLKEPEEVINAQFLMNPTAQSSIVFDKKDLKAYDNIPLEMNIYICVDPASSKNKTSNNTSIAVIGITQKGTKYLLDGVRDKLDIYETYRWLKHLYLKWDDFIPNKLRLNYGVTVLYEKYSSQRDIEVLKQEIKRDNDGVDFEIIPVGGKGSKEERVSRLLPDFKRGKFFIPSIVYKNGMLFTWKVVNMDGDTHITYENFTDIEEIKKRIEARKNPGVFLTAADLVKQTKVVPLKQMDWEGSIYDYTEEFLNEFCTFPRGDDDIVDSMSRIYDAPDLADDTMYNRITNYKLLIG